MHLNLFLQHFLYIFEKESFPSRFWDYWCSVFDPISLVNESNPQFCIFIVKKGHSPCDSYAFSSFKWKSFPFGFTFSFDNFIWIIKKYHCPCDFDALFQIFLKIFVFHLICNYIFVQWGFLFSKEKQNLKFSRDVLGGYLLMHQMKLLKEKVNPNRNNFHLKEENA